MANPNDFSSPHLFAEAVHREIQARKASTPPAAPAPAPTPGQEPLPENPLYYPAEVVRALGRERWRAALDAYDQRTGRGDPLAALRRRAR